MRPIFALVSNRKETSQCELAVREIQMHKIGLRRCCLLCLEQTSHTTEAAISLLNDLFLIRLNSAVCKCCFFHAPLLLQILASAQVVNCDNADGG